MRSVHHQGKVLLATGNAGKLRELRALLPELPWVGLKDLPPMELPESHETYAENAAEKALEASRISGLITVADDSGLEVDALGGEPGWRAALYAGGHGNDAANRAKLLSVMKAVPSSRRRAVFRCAMVLADVHGPLGNRVLSAFGSCEGRVTEAPRGTSGFGYDPLLEVPPTGKTMAELDEETKNAISHRARAVAALKPMLLAYLTAVGVTVSNRA